LRIFPGETLQACGVETDIDRIIILESRIYGQDRIKS
jgi:hypothetical protein